MGSKVQREANELVNLFYANIIHDGSKKGSAQAFANAKKCAKVHCELIQKELTEEISPSLTGFRKNYYESIDKEIEKL